jgi:gas vesicle protein
MVLALNRTAFSEAVLLLISFGDINAERMKNGKNRAKRISIFSCRLGTTVNMTQETNDYSVSDTEDDSNSPDHVWTNILAGAVIGLVVGGGLALLFAPKAGPELRADFGDTVEELKDKAEQVIDDLQASTSDLVARSRTILEQTRENLARSVEAGKDAYIQKKDELTAQLDT